MTTLACDHRFGSFRRVREGLATAICLKCQATQKYSVRVNRRYRPPATIFTPIQK